MASSSASTGKTQAHARIHFCSFCCCCCCEIENRKNKVPTLSTLVGYVLYMQPKEISRYAFSAWKWDEQILNLYLYVYVHKQTLWKKNGFCAVSANFCLVKCRLMVLICLKRSIFVARAIFDISIARWENIEWRFFEREKKQRQRNQRNIVHRLPFMWLCPEMWNYDRNCRARKSSETHLPVYQRIESKFPHFYIPSKWICFVKTWIVRWRLNWQTIGLLAKKSAHTHTHTRGRWSKSYTITRLIFV